MTYRPKKIHYPKDQYVILEDHNEMWLVGSLSRAWAKKHMEKEYGYKIMLCSQEFVDRLREDPYARQDTWWVKEGPGRPTEEKYDFKAALEADTLAEALTHIQLNLMSIEELEDLACMFAFNSGSSKIPPTKRENDLAGVCLDSIDLLESDGN